MDPRTNRNDAGKIAEKCKSLSYFVPRLLLESEYQRHIQSTEGVNITNDWKVHVVDRIVIPLQKDGLVFAIIIFKYCFMVVHLAKLH